MNKNILKYAKSLANLILKSKESDSSSIVSGFSQLLVKNGLLLRVDLILSLAKKMINKELMQRKVIIKKPKESTVSAEDLNQIKKIFPDHFFFEELVDESLISGISVETFDKKIDASVFGRLYKLKQNLVK
jgi:F0F1-type ATP synthase delta subunit